MCIFHPCNMLPHFPLPHFQRSSTQPMIETILDMVIEEVRAMFASPNFFDPTSSFAARGEKTFLNH